MGHGPQQAVQGTQLSNLQSTGQAVSGEVNQSTQEGNGGADVPSAGLPSDSQRTLHSTGAQTAKGGANQSNQEAIKVNIENPEGKAGVERGNLIEEYEKELNNAWWWACCIGSLHAFSQFLAFCNLTFATVVLLGAFVPYLAPLDFDFVLCLLLLEGARLSSASFFARLLTRALAYLSRDPKRIKHDQDEQYRRAEWARNCSRIVQFIFTFPGLIMPVIRLVSTLHHYEYAPDDPSKVRNVQKSLFLFYVSVFINSVVGLLDLLCSAIASYYVTKKFPEEQSILRYFDIVLKNAMGFGVVQADDFSFFEFAFTMLGGEFRRNVQPEAVAKNHKQLIHYIYANRLGLDFVQTYLDAEDVFVRLAAVNMVGFWADKAWGVGVQTKLRLPEGLLRNLADKVETGQVGWAAATSLGVLGALSPQWAQIVAGTCTSSNLRLPDRLANLVDDSSSRSLSLVRTLVAFYEQLCKDKQNPPTPFERADTDLVPKLKKLARGAKVHRLSVQAAYLLRLMDKECDAEVIRHIEPIKDKYWFQSEVDMLQLLLRVIRNQDPKIPYLPADIHGDRTIDPPSWAVRPIEQVEVGATVQHLEITSTVA